MLQQHSNASLSENWRLVNIDLLDPESSSNFDTTTLHPAFAPVSDNEVRTLAQQVKQLLRGGDAEGALRGALESAPYGGDAGVKVCGGLQTGGSARGRNRADESWRIIPGKGFHEYMLIEKIRKSISRPSRKFCSQSRHPK